MGNNRGSFILKGGVVVSQKGEKVILNKKSLNLFGKYLNLDFSKIINTFS